MTAYQLLTLNLFYGGATVDLPQQKEVHTSYLVTVSVPSSLIRRHSAKKMSASSKSIKQDIKSLLRVVGITESVHEVK